MAEPVVSFVIERLGDLLIQEAIFLHGVTGQVQRMQTEMKWMQCFLKDADAIQERDERVRNWVAEIRDIAYDAEDVIDTFIFKVAFRRRGGLCGILKRYGCIFNEWIDLHKVGMEMEAIQAGIHDISTSLQTYGIRSISEGEGTSSTNKRQQQLRRSYSHVEDEDVIGLEEGIKVLVAELIKEEVRLRVVSIVGMGGSGKTTLAKKVYNHDVIKRHFDCTAWAFVSQQCRTRDVIQGIFENVANPTKEMDIENMREEKLVKKLYKFLEEKRYLVVFDDTWTTVDWDSLKPAFPNGKMGSKVLLTTRNKEVASYANPWSHFCYETRNLTEGESWKLLCNKVFPKDVGKGCPPGFEKFKREMIEKCGGLPLAVVVLGGILATKKSLNEWEMVLSNINSYLDKGQQQERVLGILALSYTDLPYHLKPCFLYLGIFPEDFAISVGKLIRLWVAEGFIPPPQQGGGEETTEDVARHYLTELIHRCMVQVGERSSTGSFKTCRVHDLMRDLCLLKAREENFLEIYHRGNMMVDDSSLVVGVAPLTAAKSRRRAIHTSLLKGYTCMFEHGALNLRSLLFIGRMFSANLDKMPLKFLCQDFKLLRVLELEGVVIRGRLPREIGMLIHLRYLGLVETIVEELPPSLGKLQNLQTLHLRANNISVPNVIWKMEKLRHLYLTKYRNQAHLRMDTLTNLQTLKYAYGGSWIEEGQLAKLTNIQKLSIYKISSLEQVEAVLESPVVRFDRLQSLTFVLSNEGMMFPNLTSLSHCHHLFKLCLQGRIGMHHQYEFLPPNLTKLTLQDSRLEQDPMATLEKLPNLRILRLFTNAYVGKEIVCSAEGFPRLEDLSLFTLYSLEDWIVEEGSMPSLRSIVIYNCRNLSMVPEGLRFVKTLREVEIRQMPREFDDRLRREGVDYFKVKHIPSVTFAATLF